jgi:hypothetical protein
MDRHHEIWVREIFSFFTHNLSPRTMSKRNNSAADAGSKKSKKSDSNPATDRILAMPNEDILPFLLAPISVETFFSQHWERAPLHIKRNDPTYFDGIFSKAILDRCLRERPLEYKFNINVCQCIDGVKVDQNGDTEAPVDPDYIQARYKAGSTLQALHPQQYTPAVWKINSALEDTFGALVGANCYLTPPGSQGLAPHWYALHVSSGFSSLTSLIIALLF